MSTITHLNPNGIEMPSYEERVDLAAAFRLAVEFEWHESVGNHFSMAVSDDGKTFLLNPRWQHFSNDQGQRSAGSECRR